MPWKSNKDQLYRSLRKKAPGIDGELNKANKQTADEIASLARSFSQNDRVRGSIRTEPSGERQAWMVVAGDQSTISTAGRYPFQLAIGEEFGTKPHIVGGMFAGAQHPGTAARPFFYPAYRLGAKRHKGRATRALRKGLEKR